ncbi:MAG: hypothetical protein OXG35_06185 [Acidobacteria bacterium]|nr:hypothetical protein [Acidobacteriota bacterium]
MFKAVTFTVRGDTAFPSDMLRYDRCHPRTHDDVSAMMTTGTRTVNLRRYYQPGGRDEPTRERWESFGWRVLEGSIKQVR